MKEDLKELRRARGKGVVAIVRSDDDVADVLMVQGEKEPKDSWMIDSGCSHHICARRE